MRKVIIMLCLVMVILLVGCKDITDTFKAGNFGKTTQENAMVEAITEKYGDLTQDGEPRILEAMVTSDVENFIPIDIISKYSVNSEKLIAWFVYDNFHEAEVEIEWIYLDDNYSIHTFKSTTGEDFGRGAFILEQPDDGWVTGQYQVVIRGHGIQEIVPFEIIDGATVSVPLPLINGKIKLVSASGTSPEPLQTTSATTTSQPAVTASTTTSTTTSQPAVTASTTTSTTTSQPAVIASTSSTVSPGWYFTHWEYIISTVDETLVGAIESRSSAGDLLLDYNNGKGDKNNFHISHVRTFGDGTGIASGACAIAWTDPQQFVAEGQKLSMNLNYQIESSWGIPQLSVTVDMHDINPGGGTYGKINFATTDGIAYLSKNYEGSFEAQKGMPKSKPGDKKAVIMNLGNGYGFKYYYEWRN